MHYLYQTINISRMAQTYDCSAYGVGLYDTEACQTTGSNPPSELVNTGVAVIGIVTVACVILLVAIVVRVWKRPTKKK